MKVQVILLMVVSAFVAFVQSQRSIYLVQDHGKLCAVKKLAGTPTPYNPYPEPIYIKECRPLIPVIRNN